MQHPPSCSGFHPQRNEKLMRAKGSKEMQRLMKRCTEEQQRGRQQ